MLVFRPPSLFEIIKKDPPSKKNKNKNNNNNKQKKKKEWRLESPINCLYYGLWYSIEDIMKINVKLSISSRDYFSICKNLQLFILVFKLVVCNCMVLVNVTKTVLDM